MFGKIEIANWRQFERIDIEFHDKLTILTGANASGKTTILQILAQHFGWDLRFVSTSRKNSKKILEAFSDFWGKQSHIKKDRNQIRIGQIFYRDGSEAELDVPSQDAPTYNVTINPLQAMPGLYSIPQTYPCL